MKKNKRHIAVLALTSAALFAWTAPRAAETPFVGRPIYSEPKTGISLPPGCNFEANWRARLPNSDLELWITECSLVPSLWLLRRSVVAYEANNQARLRFEVIDERRFPGETAGETVSIKCTGKAGGEAGYAVVGASWRVVKPGQLTLANAKDAYAIDRKAGKLMETKLAQIECARFLEREEQMRRLEGRPAGRP